jgi:ParB-like chromosome segregation protein Spo0J
MDYKIEIWSIEKLVFYARNPRKNDAAVDRMCASIREFGFKIPVLARSGMTSYSPLSCSTSRV